MIATFNNVNKSFTLQCNDKEWEAIQSLNRVNGSVYVGNEITKWCEAKDTHRLYLRGNVLLYWFNGITPEQQQAFLESKGINFRD